MIVDVHCHLFNADDLPVAGFVEHHEKLDWVRGRGALSKLLARYIQHRAPDIATDRARLHRVLTGTEDARDPLFPLEQEEKQVEADLTTDPALKAELEAELAASDELDGAGSEFYGPADIKRAYRWAALFAQSRVDLPGQYAASSGRTVDLAIPMLVDLDAGVRDRSRSSRADQVEVFDLVSQASMKGLLPGAPRLVLHPLVGYDPLRELGHAGDGESPLELVQRAVLEHGFVGVKVYPPMGWRPSGNDTRPDLPKEQGRRLDEIVLGLARWCAAENVPITTHCNNSNYVGSAYRGFGHPSQWGPVLEACPDLRLNVGHFGGAHASAAEYDWARAIADLTDEHTGLYADVGCHPIATTSDLTVHLAVVAELARRHTPLLDRVMFGTDWYMQAINKNHEQFLEIYRSSWGTTFGPDRVDGFMSDNALSFLGFARPNDKNAARLAARYDALGVARPDWLTP